MRIIFMGTPEFAVPSLRGLLDAGHKIVAVVTAPDKPAGRGLHVKLSAIKQLAKERGLKIMQPQRLATAKLHEELKVLQPELFAIVAFRILPEELIAIPSKGAVNLHASLLPHYRGAAPINWAIINGEKETGVTTFFIKLKVDTGNILMQESTPIGEDETAGELHNRLMILGAELVIQTVKGIEGGSLKAKPQADQPDLKRAPKIFPDDCRLTPGLASEQIHNFIRGLSPHPGAWTMHKEKRLKVLYSQRTDLRPGLSDFIFTEHGHLFLETADGRIELTEVQPEGKKKMSGEEFVRGWR